MQCAECLGSGNDGGCSTCAGTGAVCPGCKGAGWTASDSKFEFGKPSMLKRCPVCGGDPVVAATAVKRQLGRGE